MTTELLVTSKWIWADYVIAGIMFISAMTGFFRGFIKEAFGLLAWAAAVWTGMHYCHDLAQLFEKQIDYPSLRIGLAFMLLFFLVLVVAGLLSSLLSQLVDRTGLTGSDRLLGMGFGLFRGMFVVALLILLAGLTPLPQDPWWKASQLIPPFQNLALWLKDRLPSNVADYLKFR